MDNYSYKNNLLSIFSLFTSFGTLVCCALPALLVTLGLGASLAGLVGAAPWITALSDYKEYIFMGAGAMLVAAAVMQWHARNAPCPIDPIQAKTCMKLRKINIFILIFSFLIYGTGVFFAFFAADLLL